MSIHIHNVLPHHNLYWKRLKLQDGVLDIRYCQPALILVNWVIFLCVCIIPFHDEEGIIASVWLYGVLILLSLFSVTINRGILIDSNNKIMWIWAKWFIIRWVKTIRPAEYLQYKLVTKEEGRDGIKVNVFKLMQYSVYLEVESESVLVFKGNKKDAGVFEARMHDFFNSKLLEWDAPKGRMIYWGYAYPLMFGPFFLMFFYAFVILP